MHRFDKEDHAAHVFRQIASDAWPVRLHHDELVQVPKIPGEEDIVIVIAVGDTHKKGRHLPSKEILDKSADAFREVGVTDEPNWYHAYCCKKCGT